MLLGGAALLFLKTMAAFVGLGLIAPVDISEIRPTLGSFSLGLRATCLWLQSADAFTVLDVAAWERCSLGVAQSANRAAVIEIFDHSITVKNINGVVAEAFLGVLFLLSWIWQG